MEHKASPSECYVQVILDEVALNGDLCLPEPATGLVVFAHGSGSSRHSPRNRFVAQMLRDASLGTFLFDLLTPEEEAEDLITGRQRFDIDLLTHRLIRVTDWLRSNEPTRQLRMGLFGASTGAAAALVAAAKRPDAISAVVSRGGRPDLAAPVLDQVKAPTLLIVGGDDEPVIGLNRQALAALRAEKQLVIVPRATHLFEEPGALEQVAKLAQDWFIKHLANKT
ncbi:MAG: dienelactone hydrolase family protein [Chloroflexi bacterium]|nr:dienelactone hydrolase family protein [Chloroflexota bacterium]